MEIKTYLPIYHREGGDYTGGGGNGGGLHIRRVRTIWIKACCGVKYEAYKPTDF